MPCDRRPDYLPQTWDIFVEVTLFDLVQVEQVDSIQARASLGENLIQDVEKRQVIEGPGGHTNQKTSAPIDRIAGTP
jgi:hypothetical protein